MTGVADTLFSDAEFGRPLLFSALGHGVLAALLILGVGISRSSTTPAPVFVELIAAAPPRARAQPEVHARPHQRIVQPVVIPPSRRVVHKPKAKPKPAPRVHESPAKEPAPAARAERAPTAEELLAQLRERVSARPQVQESQAPPGGRGRFDPLLARYQRQVLARLRANWTGVRAFQNRVGLRVRYQVRLDSEGALREVALAEGSGNSFFDESAERAIRRTDPYPRPPRGEVTLDLTFEPGGVY